MKKLPIRIFTHLTCGLLICLVAAVAVAEDNNSQPPAEETQAAPAKEQEAQPPAQPEPEKPQEKQPEPQPEKPKDEDKEAEAKPAPEQQSPNNEQPAEPAPEQKEIQSETPEPQEEKPAAQPEEQKQPEKPAEEPKWKSHLQEKHKPFFEWFEKNYPKKADKLKELGNSDPDKFNQRMNHAMKIYNPIQRAEKNKNHELAKVLREDVELKFRRDQLLRKLPSVPEDQRQPLLDELKQVISARFDVIIQKKQLEYNQIRGRMDWLNKKLEQHGSELQKLKDEKDQSVEKRMKELVEGKIKIDW